MGKRETRRSIFGEKIECSDVRTSPYYGTEKMQPKSPKLCSKISEVLTELNSAYRQVVLCEHCRLILVSKLASCF